jgi:alpha-mannosidase
MTALPCRYYAGINNIIARGTVKNLLSSVMLSLWENPDRKFIEVETAYFERWWNEQTPSMQDTVKQLVANGQLEFINGCVS